MKKFESIFNLSARTTILDIGGNQFNWRFTSVKPQITVMNISELPDWDSTQENFRFEIGDGTSMKYKDRSFDIAYSNSVIEHLGTPTNQERYAKELLRVGKSIYVQTPAKEFFFEPHLITPFIHWLPLLWQSKLMRNFTVWGLITRPTMQHINTFLSERRLLTFREIKNLFPGCKVYRERFLFLTKCYIVVKLDKQYDRFPLDALE